MGRYLLLWEVDRTKMPVDAKERGAGFNMLVDMVKEDIKTGKTKDWGAYVGEYFGYTIAEGTELEIMNQLERFSPFIIFKVHPIASITQVEEYIKAQIK
jgi:hypothetical protein